MTKKALCGGVWPTFSLTFLSTEAMEAVNGNLTFN